MKQQAEVLCLFGEGKTEVFSPACSRFLKICLHKFLIPSISARQARSRFAALQPVGALFRNKVSAKSPSFGDATKRPSVRNAH